MSFLSTELLVFGIKALIIVVSFLVLLFGIVAIASKNKGRPKLKMTNLNDQYEECIEDLREAVIDKKQRKAKRKAAKKTKKKDRRNIFVLDFNGDIQASRVEALRHEITAILSVATPQDEVVVRLESPGGVVPSYGLAASQLSRLKDHNIPLTVTIDRVAASGGYLMASVANKVFAAPFAIIGSIGVVAQIPNFHRLLKKHDIDYELLTAGKYKRTMTVFGENTKEGRDKALAEIEDIHTLFKDHITHYRPQVNIEEVATGEYWPALRAKEFKLVDELITSDDYLFNQREQANLIHLRYHLKKTRMGKIKEQALAFITSLQSYPF